MLIVILDLGSPSERSSAPWLARRAYGNRKESIAIPTDAIDGMRRTPWQVVVVGFLALAVAYSARAALSLIMPTWDAELGWSRSFVSGVAALALFMMAVLAPIGGRLVDRQGARACLLTGLAALTAGCLIVALIESRLLFVLAFGILSAVGFGLIATHVVSTAVEQQFTRNKGLAIGIATSGSTAGQFVIVPLIAILLTAMSWRWSFLALGLLSIAMIVWIRFSLPAGRPVDSTTDSGSVHPGLIGDLITVAKSPAFHILLWSYVICGYTTTGVIETHFLPYAAFCGFPAVPSATAYGLLSAVNMGGMILAGWLSDRMNRPLLLGSIYLVRAIAFMLLVNVGADLPTLFFFAALFGVVDYSTLPVTASLVASHLGLRVTGLAMGLIIAGHQFGGAAGAYLGGYLFDANADYGWVWWSSVWLSGIAGVLVFFLGDRPAMARAASV